MTFPDWSGGLPEKEAFFCRWHIGDERNREQSSTSFIGKRFYVPPGKKRRSLGGYLCCR